MGFEHTPPYGDHKTLMLEFGALNHSAILTVESSAHF